ncbi:MAG: hypothetical protein U5L96_10465 [Owenweeksia sp.]|nr:hypothetical protein [Owenweeksia sp.]
MNLIKKDAGNAESINSLFNDLFHDNFMNWPAKSWENRRQHMPAVNVSETDHIWKLEIAVPGIAKEDFNIELDRG